MNKKKTVKNYEEFKFVMNCGKKFFEEYGIVFKMEKEKFVIKFPKYANVFEDLYGIMATRKLGNAVTRNYIKRKIRIALKNQDFKNEVWIVLGIIKKNKSKK